LHVLLIHNPGSGGEDHDRDALVARLALVGHDVDYRSTEEDEWIDALSAKPDLFAVAGGDGTVNRVFKELAGNSTPVTVIPLGTANNIAETLGLAGASAGELITAWPDFVLRRFDVGEASAPWGRRQFVETAGAGLLAELFRSAEEQDEPDDKVRHGLELLRDALAVVRPARWQLELDGADLSGELIGVEAMNICEVGPELTLAPSADPGDGLLDVVLIADEHRDALRAHVDARLGGTPAPSPELTAHRGHELTLTPPQGMALHVDDDPWPIEADGPIVVRGGVQHVNALAPTPRA
jgi:diacylglycerol kinase family enzyme